MLWEIRVPLPFSLFAILEYRQHPEKKVRQCLFLVCILKYSVMVADTFMIKQMVLAHS